MVAEAASWQLSGWKSGPTVQGETKATVRGCVLLLIGLDHSEPETCRRSPRLQSRESGRARRRPLDSEGLQLRHAHVAPVVAGEPLEEIGFGAPQDALAHLVGVAHDVSHGRPGLAEDAGAQCERGLAAPQPQLAALVVSLVRREEELHTLESEVGGRKFEAAIVSRVDDGVSVPTPWRSQTRDCPLERLKLKWVRVLRAACECASSSSLRTTSAPKQEVYQVYGPETHPLQLLLDFTEPPPCAGNRHRRRVCRIWRRSLAACTPRLLLQAPEALSGARRRSRRRATRRRPPNRRMRTECERRVCEVMLCNALALLLLEMTRKGLERHQSAVDALLKLGKHSASLDEEGDHMQATPTRHYTDPHPQRTTRNFTFASSSVTAVLTTTIPSLAPGRTTGRFGRCPPSGRSLLPLRP